MSTNIAATLYGSHMVWANWNVKFIYMPIFQAYFCNFTDYNAVLVFYMPKPPNFSKI